MNMNLIILGRIVAFTIIVRNSSDLLKLYDFTYCSLVYTVPYNLCRKCIYDYTQLRDIYGSLANPQIVADNSSCPEDIISKDKLANIINYYSQSKNIWINGNCDNCYDFMKGDDLKNLDKFFGMVESLEECIVESDSSNLTCTSCQQNYTNLNDYFLKLTSHYGSSLCYDIIDTMSLARSTWSHNLGCYVDHSFDVPTLAIALLVLTLLPVIFYALGRCFCHQSGPKLMQQKRLSSINLFHERSRLLNNPVASGE